LEDYDCDDDDEIPEIPLDNIDAETLKLVLIYCRRHRGEPAPTEDEIRDTRRDPIPEWDLEFITMPQAQLFRLFLASNFLDIKGLMELCAKHIASMIERNTTSQICETFNIPEDLTPEETKQLAKENEWLEA
jgi:S-phase kinase-associated protein 1